MTIVSKHARAPHKAQYANEWVDHTTTVNAQSKQNTMKREQGYEWSHNVTIATFMLLE